ncbi:nuclear transport factor 2 family protein [Candidatus Nitrosocosmicus hydrocola]|uniref:nuclear transport factor 2 family protein n=1 Tax=Candidatus Nitrosocosmicus hydrocola TaxID=1826872 RepID=UPI0011E5F718|nr:nuclear transport factor 2 family protein [Candidatus Nitrosocosmicus hydrocola]
MSDNKEIQLMLEYHWKYTGIDIDKSHEIYRDDVVVEFPQSGERISGKNNLYQLRKHYPAKLGFKVLRTRGEGKFWVTEYIITYDGRPVNVVCIMEFIEDKIVHETLYFGDPFEPPRWRSQWVIKTS